MPCCGKTVCEHQAEQLRRADSNREDAEQQQSENQQETKEQP